MKLSIADATPLSPQYILSCTSSDLSGPSDNIQRLAIKHTQVNSFFGENIPELQHYLVIKTQSDLNDTSFTAFDSSITDLHDVILFYINQSTFDSVVDYVMQEVYIPLCNAVGSAKANNAISNGDGGFPVIDQFIDAQEKLLNQMTTDSIYYGKKLRLKLDNALAYRMKDDYLTTLQKLDAVHAWADSADKSLVDHWICIVTNEKLMIDSVIDEQQFMNNVLACLPNDLPPPPADIYADHEWTPPV